MKNFKYRGMKAALAAALILSPLAPLFPAQAQVAETETFFDMPETFGQVLQHLGSYDSGFTAADGGVAEIVAFNPADQVMYVINGLTQLIDVVPLGHLQSGQINNFEATKRINIAEIGYEHGFEAADITSVAYHRGLEIVAVAVQSYHWMDNGTIVILDREGNYLTHVEAGNQPDMIGISPDGNFIMTANEGEPVSAFTDGDTFGVVLGPGAHGSNANTTSNWDFVYDPKGGVTVVDLRGVASREQLVAELDERTNSHDFTAFDHRLAELIDNEVIIKAGNTPSRDLEPEYVTFSADGKTAFVALQENNAIAHFDLLEMAFTGVYGIGFIDHSLAGSEINLNDNEINIRNENVFGMPMPDGISAIEINGVQYILTANEGDAREWDFYRPGTNSGGGNRARYRNFRRSMINGSAAVENLVNEMHYVTNQRLDDWFIFGSRSFSIIRADNMEMVFDSGSDFERITAETFPSIFNAHHRENVWNTRSSRKGPEPESVVSLSHAGRHFALVGLERIGGVMMYDITNPSEAFFVDYLNIRNPEINGPDAGDLGVEGMYAISAAESPTGNPIVLAANEVSGTVTVMEVNIEGEERPGLEGEENLGEEDDEEILPESNLSVEEQEKLNVLTVQASHMRSLIYTDELREENFTVSTWSDFISALEYAEEVVDSLSGELSFTRSQSTHLERIVAAYDNLSTAHGNLEEVIQEETQEESQEETTEAGGGTDEGSNDSDQHDENQTADEGNNDTSDTAEEESENAEQGNTVTQENNNNQSTPGNHNQQSVRPTQPNHPANNLPATGQAASALVPIGAVVLVAAVFFARKKK
ncbi:MAG: choice-of-anchor I family protein [Turicibacter sp.]|nr:choice-of-anchor I family protein [Turicibacter sp.]